MAKICCLLHFVAHFRKRPNDRIKLSPLVEFGLIREDYKHKKLISKKEKDDGINRPYQYSVTENGKGFLIVSAGFDCKFETERLY
jgi:chromosome segregation and condensation protein ScpB